MPVTGIATVCMALILIGGGFYAASLSKNGRISTSAPLVAPGPVSASSPLPADSGTKTPENAFGEVIQQPSKAKGQVLLRPVVINIPEQPTEPSKQNEAQLAKLYATMNQPSGAATEGRSISGDTIGISAGEDVAASSVSIPAIESNAVEERSVDFAEILAKAQSELGVSPLVDSTDPLLETLSQQIKDNIPSLIYSAHDFRPSGRSSVVLNGESAGERQKVGAFTVVEILPDSVILRWRETQFRVRARNSWINM
jgi:hypothetical protein